jgi:hypothetical protein
VARRRVGIRSEERLREDPPQQVAVAEAAVPVSIRPSRTQSFVASVLTSSD